MTAGRSTAAQRAEFSFDGRAIPFAPGQSIGAALWAAGVTTLRVTRRRARPRGLFCGIGVCFDCLVVLGDGEQVRACQQVARAGMQVSSRAGEE